MDLDWRERAVADALEEGSGGFSTEAGGIIMAAIKRNRPKSTQVVVHHEDQDRALEILRRESRELRGLLTTVSRYEGGGTETGKTLYTWFGWHAFMWEGEEVELAAATFADTHKLIFFSDSSEAAVAAASLVGEETQWPGGSCLEFEGRWRDAPEMDAELEEASWEGVVLPEETVSGIRLSSEGFFDRRESYHEMGFPWQRGLMFVGPPGTGKTMVMKAIAGTVTREKPGVPFLYVRELGDMGGAGGRAIASIFARARRVAPCILAFEDIDGFVNESNRSVFLNWLDGLQKNDGVLILASSNHPGRVDEALLKRPSRFDRVFHLGLPALEERERYLRALLSAEPVAGRFGSRRALEEAAARVAGNTDGFTPAHLKETVLSAALVLAHGEGTRGEHEAPAGDFAGDFAEALLEQAASLRAYMKSARTPEKLGEMELPGDPPGFSA